MILIKELKETYEGMFHHSNILECYPKGRVEDMYYDSGIYYLHQKWIYCNTYHKLFCVPTEAIKRRVVISGPGYGKSILTMKLAYDWCYQIQESYLKNVEILIVLKMRQLDNKRTLSKAIKDLLLPSDSSMEEETIQMVLKNCKSLVVILDGVDEYPNLELQSEITDIMKFKLFEQTSVIFTSRYLPKEFVSTVKQLQLPEFKDDVQDAYLERFFQDDQSVASSIKSQLRENGVLGDICRIPFFFFLFVQLVHDDREFMSTKSITDFFKSVMECVIYHFKEKMKDKNVQNYPIIQENNRHLEKLAFNGLVSKQKKMNWTKEELCDKLGRDVFDQHLELGIFVEESSDAGKVKFYHSLFQAWFASFYFSRYALTADMVSMRKRLQHTHSSDLQYVYRFACGHSPRLIKKVIEYLQSDKTADALKYLCVFEIKKNIANLDDLVEDLCSQTIEVDGSQEALLKRSKVFLLKKASLNEIPIQRLLLTECSITVNQETDLPRLGSNLGLPVMVTLEALWITENAREITMDETVQLVKYTSKCSRLKLVGFKHCKMPNEIPVITLGDLKSRKVNVLWVQMNDDTLRLDFTDGKWKSQRQTSMSPKRIHYKTTPVRQEQVKKMITTPVREKRVKTLI